MDTSTVKLPRRTAWAHDLLPSDRRFLAAIDELVFGRFELLRIEPGELLLDPWPKTVRDVRFGSENATAHKGFREAFELRRPIIEFFDYVRGVRDSEILCLEVRHSLPFSMQIEQPLVTNSVPRAVHV
jgi:hypothetical protein